MPYQETPPAGDRFFARLSNFTCECPHCGYVVRTTVLGLPAWNPATQRLRCPGCHRVFIAGLLLYPCATRRELVPPEDTVPTPRQALALRNEAGGYLTEEPYWEPGQAVNVATTAAPTPPVPEPTTGHAEGILTQALALIGRAKPLENGSAGDQGDQGGGAGGVKGVHIGVKY